jgi:CHAT domain-containing protein
LGPRTSTPRAGRWRTFKFAFLTHGPPGLSRKGLKYLPGTLAELQRICAEARDALKVEPVALQGKQAGVAALLERLPKARYAHVATHGFFADAKIRSVLQVDERHFLRAGDERAVAGARNPLVLSGLVLAGANRPDAGPDRGILTAEGIIGLNLEGMDLAVLSACETGLCEVAGGCFANSATRSCFVDTVVECKDRNKLSSPAGGGSSARRCEAREVICEMPKVAEWQTLLSA